MLQLKQKGRSTEIVDRPFLLLNLIARGTNDYVNDSCHNIARPITIYFAAGQNSDLLLAMDTRLEIRQESKSVLWVSCVTIRLRRRITSPWVADTTILMCCVSWHYVTTIFVVLVPLLALFDTGIVNVALKVPALLFRLQIFAPIFTTESN